MSSSSPSPYKMSSPSLGASKKKKIVEFRIDIDNIIKDLENLIVDGDGNDFKKRLNYFIYGNSYGLNDFLHKLNQDQQNVTGRLINAEMGINAIGDSESSKKFLPPNSQYFWFYSIMRSNLNATEFHKFGDDLLTKLETEFGSDYDFIKSYRNITTIEEVIVYYYCLFL
jgi:hypothetical protein